jgi:hypothetical protein
MTAYQLDLYLKEFMEALFEYGSQLLGKRLVLAGSVGPINDKKGSCWQFRRETHDVRRCEHYLPA